MATAGSPAVSPAFARADSSRSRTQRRFGRFVSGSWFARKFMARSLLTGSVMSRTKAAKVPVSGRHRPVTDTSLKEPFLRMILVSKEIPAVRPLPERSSFRPPGNGLPGRSKMDMVRSFSAEHPAILENLSLTLRNVPPLSRTKYPSSMVRRIRPSSSVLSAIRPTIHGLHEPHRSPGTP